MSFQQLQNFLHEIRNRMKQLQIYFGKHDKTLISNQLMKSRQATANNLLKKLYGYTHNKSLAFKSILSVHKCIFEAIGHGEVKIRQKPIGIDKEVVEYKGENKLRMDEQTMYQCVSVWDIFTGKQSQKKKYSLKQREIAKRQQQRKLSKQKSQRALLQKEQEYIEKMKQFQRQKQVIEEKKRMEQIRRLGQLREEEQRERRQKQKQGERQREEKRRKLEAGLREMEEKRKQRQEMIKQLAVEHKRSRSIKVLNQYVPQYVRLEQQYLSNQRKKAEQTKQLQRQKRESMQLKIDQIKSHQKEYIEKLKQKFTSSRVNNNPNEGEGRLGKAKSEFNLVRMKDEQDEQRQRQKVQRRKQFEGRLRNISVQIDTNKKKQKQIEIDKSINKQKYILLARRHLADDQIFTEFKDFQLKIDPKTVGKNYLNQIKHSRGPRSEKISKQSSEEFLTQKTEKNTYINYLQQLRLKGKSARKSEPQSHIQNDQLLKLVERSKHILKKANHQKQYQRQLHNSPLDKSRLSLKQSSVKMALDTPSKLKQNELKNQVTKSITQKIVQYERKVLKKVNDLKKISQYDDSLKKQTQIDDLFSKVLKAKIDTIDLT